MSLPREVGLCAVLCLFFKSKILMVEAERSHGRPHAQSCNVKVSLCRIPIVRWQRQTS